MLPSTRTRLATVVFLCFASFYSLSPGIHAAENELTAAEKSAGWVLLFDGTSTRGWMSPKGQPLPASHVEDGALNPHPCDYMLVHERVWDDFQLALDFKISKGCNSGIFIRTFPLEARPGKDVGYNGIEIAIDDTSTAGFHDTGAIYDLAKPAKNAMRPAGEWNHAVITCDRNLIEIAINGERINRLDLDEWTRPNLRPDGSEHKFDVAWKHHPRRGFIGLQDHGSDCWFKNIKLLPLDSSRPVRREEEFQSPRVPILAWYSIPEGELTPARFRELADAGITHSLMHYSPAGNQKALDLAREVGVRLFVGDGRFHERGAKLAEAVAEYRDHPALAGYLLRDEPPVDAFRELASIRDEIAKSDSKHWSYVNLLPTYASPEQLGSETYDGHVRRFLFEFRPEVLSFDHYSIIAEPGPESGASGDKDRSGARLRSDYYRNLEEIRRAALDFDVPFWAFALTCPHSPYPMPALGHLRFQVWSNFAYGAKGLEYFTYWTPAPGRWDFHDAPIRLDGTRSETYELLSELDRDVQLCAGIIEGSRVAAVYHTAPLPDGTRGLDASSPFETIEGGEALVGVHVLPGGSRYALVVNRRFDAPAKLRLALAPWVTKVAYDHQVSGAKLTEESGRTVTLELEAGAAAFLSLEAAR